MTKHRVAQDISELPKLQEILPMSGLEFMQAVVNGEFSSPPIGEALNYWPILAEDGKVVFEGIPQFNCLNPLGTVHGGWYGTVLDSCMACAVQTKLKPGQLYTTLEYKINIIRPIPVGTKVHAIGKVQHAGRSTGIADGEIVGVEDGRLYATGSTTCIVMNAPTM